MPNKKKTGWIQTLNKTEIIAELGKREVQFSEHDSFNKLRELLRET